MNEGGCTKKSACNYNPDAVWDDNSCEYPEENFDCDGNCISNIDCTGICGGSSTLDPCGNCDSNPANDCPEECVGKFILQGWQGDYECRVCIEGTWTFESPPYKKVYHSLSIFNAGIYSVNTISIDFEYFGPNYSMESGWVYINDISLPPGNSFEYYDVDWTSMNQVDSVIFTGGRSTCD